MFVPLGCSPCCGATPPAPCPPVPEDITAVEVDLRWSGEPFRVYSNQGDGEIVFEVADLSSWTGTYSLSQVSATRWEYNWAPRSDGVVPNIFYLSNSDYIAFYNPPGVFCKEWNGSEYIVFETCWDPQNPRASQYTSVCTREWPLAAFNSGIVMSSFGATTDLTAGSGGTTVARRCVGTNIGLIGWTSAGRVGDPRVYIDDVRTYQ